jgi:hypothetical protein
MTGFGVRDNALTTATIAAKRKGQPMTERGNVTPFPTHLIGVKRQDDGTRSANLPIRRGTLDIYVGYNGMTLIDAGVPAAIASQIVALIRDADVAITVE